MYNRHRFYLCVLAVASLASAQSVAFVAYLLAYFFLRPLRQKSTQGPCVACVWCRYRLHSYVPAGQDSYVPASSIYLPWQVIASRTGHNVLRQLDAAAADDLTCVRDVAKHSVGVSDVKW